MGLEIIKELNIDFNDTRYISINAKQYDKSSRYILVTCYNHGVNLPIDNMYNYVYVRARKPDDNGVFNTCEITSDGKILVELTPQMLSFVGKIFVDLVIVHNEPIPIDSIEFNNGKLLTNENTSVISTMLFCINVIESSVDNDTIESSSEYGALNELLIKATEDYTYVMTASKVSEDNARKSADASKESADNAETYKLEAEEFKMVASESANAAQKSENAAKESEEAARIVQEQAEELVQSVADAIEGVELSIIKAEEALHSATLAQSYSIGGTNTRTNEDTDNAKYYYTQTKNLSESVEGSFKPKGTIAFSELQSVEKSSGNVYHIGDSFVTDNTFKEGSGVSYPAGTSVYYTVDGYWDCFVGDKLTITDDGEGNVGLICTYDFISTYSEIDEINRRIKTLEEQSVLEINE